MSYLLRHNATIHGNDTYVMYGSEHSQFSIDVPSGCVGPVFTVSIAAVNALSIGKWTSVQFESVQFEIVQDSSSTTGMYYMSHFMKHATNYIVHAFKMALKCIDTIFYTY